MVTQAFETTSVHMERLFLLTFQAPPEDADRGMAAVTTIAPLAMGEYDSNAYQSTAGIERYRPLEGAAAGAETERRRRSVVECTFEVAHQQTPLEAVVEAIVQVRSYQEPVMRVREILSSRSNGLDDSATRIAGGTR